MIDGRMYVPLVRQRDHRVACYLRPDHAFALARIIFDGIDKARISPDAETTFWLAAYSAIAISSSVPEIVSADRAAAAASDRRPLLTSETMLRLAALSDDTAPRATTAGDLKSEFFAETAGDQFRELAQRLSSTNTGAP